MASVAPRCMACNAAPASVFCQADDAHLCVKCDHVVHSANKVSRRHVRQPLHNVPRDLLPSNIPDAAAYAFPSTDGTGAVEKLKKREKKSILEDRPPPSPPPPPPHSVPHTTQKHAQDPVSKRNGSRTHPQVEGKRSPTVVGTHTHAHSHSHSPSTAIDGANGHDHGDGGHTLESSRMLEIVANACLRREAEALSERLGYALPLSFKRRSSTSASTSANDGSMNDLLPSASASASVSTLAANSFDGEPPPPPPSPPKKPQSQLSKAKSKAKSLTPPTNNRHQNQQPHNHKQATTNKSAKQKSLHTPSTKRSSSSQPVTKKVRYECRRILAESRPRVRGRFVAKPKDKPNTTNVTTTTTTTTTATTTTNT